jgi:hypothetical protein
MESLRLEDAKSLTGSILHAWIEEAEERARYGYGTGEIATQMDATVSAVKYLLNYHA